MGQPVNNSSSSSSSSAPAAATPQTTTQPSQSQSQPHPPASTLPPEALDLAARLFDYAREGKASELQQYVSAGIPPNLTDAGGNTLLMLAAYHGQVETVRALVAAGADVDAENDRGQRIIAGAVFKGYDDVVKELLAAGADVRGGQPCALDCARMFKRDDLLALFDADGGVEGGGVPGVPGAPPPPQHGS